MKIGQAEITTITPKSTASMMNCHFLSCAKYLVNSRKERREVDLPAVVRAIGLFGSVITLIVERSISRGPHYVTLRIVKIT
jgi:hypothetical protein